MIDTLSLVMTKNEAHMLCSKLECADFADTLIAAIRKLPNTRTAQKEDGTTSQWIAAQYKEWLSSHPDITSLPTPDKIRDALHNAQLKVLESSQKMTSKVLVSGTVDRSDHSKSFPRKGFGIFETKRAKEDQTQQPGMVPEKK